MSQTELIFRGLDEAECMSFIREVHKRAHEAGHLRDSSWMADIAMVAFDGGALKWFDEQAPETQADWALLRRALIQKYSNSRFEPLSSAAIINRPSIPTSAAPVLNPSAQLFPADSSPLFFKIKIVASQAGYQGYVSQTFDDTKFGRCCTLTEHITEAIDINLTTDDRAGHYVSYTSNFTQDWTRGERVGTCCTRKDPWCAILALWLPVPPSGGSAYSHHSPKGDEKGFSGFNGWFIDNGGKLGLNTQAELNTVITKTETCGLTLTSWERRVWDEAEDACVANLYLVRSV